MSAEAWDDPLKRSLGMLLLGHCSQIDEQGACIIGDNLLVLMNAGNNAVSFAMPRSVQRFRMFERLFDTFDGDISIVTCDPTHPYPLRPWSMALFRNKVGH